MSNLSVALTADVVDLQTKFAVAKAEVSALTSEMNKLAKQSAAGIIDPAGQAQLQQVAGDFLHAKEAAAQLAEQMKGTHEEFEGVGGALEDIRGKLSAAFEVTGIAAAAEGFREVIEVINELGEKAIQLRSTSDVLNVTVEQMQAMQVAAEEAGVSSETLVRAGEKLTVMLNEARNNSGAAVEKLKALGVSTEEALDPNFQLIDLLQLLHERLEDGNTEQETRNALLQDFGSKTALAVAAIKEFDGSQAAVAATMARINGLSRENAEAAASASAATHEWATTAENSLTKLWFGEQKVNGSLHELIQSMSELSSKAQSMNGQQVNLALGEKPEVDPNIAAQARAQARQKEVNKEIAAIQLVTKADLESEKDSIAATKAGSAERLATVKKFAQDAAVFYGPNIDKVREANRQVITETRAYYDAQGSLRAEQIRAEIKADDDSAKARLAGIKSGIDENERYFSEAVKVHDAIASMEETGQQLQTHIYQERAKISAQTNALVAKETQQQLAQWQFLTNGMKNGFASAMQGILYGAESVGQAMRGIFTSVLDGIISKLAEWAAEWVTKLIITQTANKTTAASSIAANSAVAATAAMASVAAIPFYGWAMAPEVGATTYAEGISYEAGLAAEGGFDVPAGMNPVTQLHQREMVLPQKYADVIRGQADNGGSGRGGGGSVNVQFTPVQGGYGLVHMGNLAESLRKLNGRFSFGTSHV